MTGIGVSRAMLLTIATGFAALGIFSGTTAAYRFRFGDFAVIFLRWHRRSHGSSRNQSKTAKVVPAFAASQTWLFALIPIGLTIMPINKLTILLVLALIADAAIAVLLAEDLRAYRLHQRRPKSLPPSRSAPLRPLR